MSDTVKATSKAASDEVVKVSVIHPQRFRASKNDDYIEYPIGLQEMPLAHARSLGLLHRIKQEEKTKDGKTVERNPLDALDQKLRKTLEDAGIKTIGDLQKASVDEILALGIGPAKFEQVDAVRKGGQ